MKIKEIFATLLFICGIILAVMFYNEKQSEKNNFWQNEYAKAKLETNRHKQVILGLTDTIIILKTKMANSKPKIVEKKVYIKQLKDRLALQTDTANIVAIQSTIIVEQDTTIQLLDESLTGCLKIVSLQNSVIGKKDSIIAENDKLIQLAHKNATPTFFQRNKFWFGAGAGVVVVGAIVAVVR